MIIRNKNKIVIYLTNSGGNGPMLFRSIGGKLGNWNPVASSGGVQYPWKKNTCFFNEIFLEDQNFKPKKKKKLVK